MVKFPKLKKKVSSFLTKEDGKISKESLIRTGVLLSAIAIASLKGATAQQDDCSFPPDHHNQHCHDLSVSYSKPTATGTHSNIHGSHGSHGSHSSNSWPW